MAAPIAAPATSPAANQPASDAAVADFPDASPATGELAFTVQLDAPDTVYGLIDHFLDLKRYQQVADLDNAELGLLIERSEAQIRQLLATEGYFTPEISHTLLADAAQKTQADVRPSRPTIRIHINPGTRTTVSQLDLRFDDAALAYTPAHTQLAQARYDWELLPGQAFTQAGWSSSKAHVLQTLQAERFATARLVSSKAEIDPDSNTAQLHALYDCGPVYRYGAVQVLGAARYDAAIAQRLAQTPLAAEYRQSDLQAAQRRLLDSGYYSGATVAIDTSPQASPQAAPVLVNVQEAPLQKLVLGAGFNTDSGPGASIEHTHNRLPALGWRGLSKLKWNRDQQTFTSSLLSPPDEKLWQWLLNGSYTRETFDSTVQNTWQMRLGRTKNLGRIQRTWYLQYDHSRADYASAVIKSAGAFSANYIWALHQFNNPTMPTSGYGIGMEAGGGITQSPQRAPFARASARYQGFLSLDESLGASLLQALPLPGEIREAVTGKPSATPQTTATAAIPPPKTRKNGELVLRVESAALWSRRNATIPPNLLFLTGGNATVRGYGYQQIGVDHNGITLPGRYMLSGSVEYRRPVYANARPTSWDSVIFLDAGNVADTPAGLRKLKYGAGAGALWRSPVGPVQLALAYGLQDKKLRLHMNLGFNF